MQIKTVTLLLACTSLFLRISHLACTSFPRALGVSKMQIPVFINLHSSHSSHWHCLTSRSSDKLKYLYFQLLLVVSSTMTLTYYKTWVLGFLLPSYMPNIKKLTRIVRESQINHNNMPIQERG